MAGSAVLIKNMRPFIIAAPVIKFQCTNGAVFHAAPAAQALVFIDYRILAAGCADIKKFRQEIIFPPDLFQMGLRGIGVAALGAYLQLMLNLPV